MGAGGDDWVASGAAHLTGRADGPPLVAPDDVVERMVALGRPIGVDGLPLVVQRAAAAGLERAGTTSAGGSTRLVRAADGWCAVALARPEDLDLLPAWLGEEIAPDEDPASWVAARAAARSVADLVEHGALLGLPIGRLGEVPPPPDPVQRIELASASVRHPARPLVVDLSSLWAGPLCAHLLGRRGGQVVKVESTTRPDGARDRTPRFYDALHHGHEAVALDLTSDEGRSQLQALVAAADVVIEGSRPRALAQLGIDAATVAEAGPTVWVSITAFGREGPDGQRVGFGDDAAVAGGLVAWDDDGPCFAADAIADPLTGVAAAAAATQALEQGGGWLLDVALARVAAHVAGSASEVHVAWTPAPAGEAPRPVSDRPPGRAHELGADTEAVLARLAIT